MYDFIQDYNASIQSSLSSFVEFVDFDDFECLFRLWNVLITPSDAVTPTTYTSEKKRPRERHWILVGYRDARHASRRASSSASLLLVSANRRYALMNASRFPESTPSTSAVSTPVRTSFTSLYG